MKAEILFTETQKFRKAWLLLIIVLVNALFVFGFVWQVLLGHPFGTKPASNLVLSVSLLLNFLITAFVLLTRLDTMIKQDGIYVRFFPLHRQFKRYGWDELLKIYLRTYQPIAEYGGWGYRIMIGSGKAYTISGKTGIQLELKGGSKLLIGTNKPEEASEAIKNSYQKQVPSI